MKYATKIAGAKLIVVKGHSSCGAIQGAIADARLGNLTQLLAKIVEPSRRPSIRGRGRPRTRSLSMPWRARASS